MQYIYIFLYTHIHKKSIKIQHIHGEIVSETLIWLYLELMQNRLEAGLYKKSLIVSETLTHWGRVTHICVGKLTTIGSDNGLSPGRRQAIIGRNTGILLIGPLGTNLSEILTGIQTFPFQKMSSAKWRPFCLGLNVLNKYILATL